MVEAWPKAAELDAYLLDMIKTVQGAVSLAMKHLEDDPKAVEQAYVDSKEVLDHVMEGKVHDWLS